MLHKIKPIVWKKRKEFQTTNKNTGPNTVRLPSTVIFSLHLSTRTVLIKAANLWFACANYGLAALHRA